MRVATIDSELYEAMTHTFALTALGVTCLRISTTIAIVFPTRHFTL